MSVLLGRRERRFSDEWLVRVAVQRLGVEPEAVARWRAEGRESLAEALIETGRIASGDLAGALAQAYGIATARPRREDVEALAAALVPESLARGRRLVPLRLRGESLELAMANPLDGDALADVREVSGRAPVPVYCAGRAVDALLDAVYSSAGRPPVLLEAVGDAPDVEVLGDAPPPRGPGGDDAPAVAFVDAVVADAVRRGASDVHIEHEKGRSVVRLRVDGVLRAAASLSSRRAVEAVIARIKIMSRLDITNHMRPQDGRAEVRVDGHEIGLRVSTLPTQYGETVVIRLLDSRAAEVSLDALGFLPDQARILRERAAASQGAVIVTGPTGSGKTTTLYSLLHLLRSEEVNVVTIEDPVEYRLKGINQVQIQERQGLTFASALRSVLRQDPDVIMVGEIRDAETAGIAIQAAMTGHLVLATLHANDAAAAVARLVDMGVEPYKIGPALLAVTTQRLARRLCADCRRRDPDGPYWRPVGCPECAYLGYRGQVPLLELFAPDAELRGLIAAGARGEELRRRAVLSGCLHELGADALARLARGDTALEEVLPHFDPKTLAGAPTGSGPGGGRRVLVAEDDASTRAVLGAALARGGFAVLAAEDGPQALERLRRGGADVVLTDLHMPGLEGPELVRRLREAAPAGTPIVVLTADAEEESQRVTLEAGADDYVAKPVKAPLLLARVKAALRRAAARSS